MEPEIGSTWRLVCAVYDEKVKSFLQPFFVTTKGEAMRSFADAVNDPQHGFHKHAEDFSLHVVGKWYEQAGRFENCEPAPELLTLALSVKEGESPTPFARVDKKVTHAR